eukprot:Skav206567  [mRNA]  locus=scaffold925:144281:150685:- [translate_table: standard]
MACSCCKEAVPVAEEEAAEVKEALETVVLKVEEVAEDIAEAAWSGTMGSHGVGSGEKPRKIWEAIWKELRNIIKKVTDDPEAPKSAKETKDRAIDLLWPEVEKAPQWLKQPPPWDH